ncbi:PREDICTED: phospholipid scramblase 4 isoform X2 [Myotis brandtii]|uniref:phospholipid scramblase 4 isoform X2 n=1 Tax=Myotis brandtii TaxID=109478 RepID=UPI000703E019|nr:PREDICTED: phospholipid scramblase 4 isoform X2 [Myotis brandtii]
MSGVVPTAPKQPTDEMGNQLKSPDPRPDAPPDYNSHFVPGPPGAAVLPPAGYPRGVPMGYYNPQQPSAFPYCQPTGGTHPIQYQPGNYPVPSQSAPITWMPGPTLMPDCPPGLEYLTQLEVQCPPGITIGFVMDHWNLCRAVYSIQNEKKENVLSVRGPCSTYGCGSDSVFEVKAINGISNIGSIIRKWNGLMSAMGNADHFDIHFPLDLDVKMKAMIFGACFLIDFMYFERSPQHSSR